MKRLIIVSNRLPYTAHLNGDAVTLSPSPGGLATGLEPVRKRYPSLWIGWPGKTTDMSDPQRTKLEQDLAAHSCHPVYLSQGELTGYYEQFSNAILWPLFHLLPSLLPQELTGWEEYRRVNEKFADVVAAMYREGDVIWIHDYHLFLLPQLLRERLPDAPIGFFLHIPFPPADEFRILPWREELLHGLLGADLIGFHTQGYVNAFAGALLRVSGVEARLDQVTSEDGRLVRIGAFPLGVDVGHFEKPGRASDITEALAALREKNPEVRLFLSVDRLDYTKGIEQRLLAFERFLERYPRYKRHAILIQIATAPRTGIQAFEDTKRQVDEIAGRVNGRFGEPDYQPIHYISRKFSRNELVQLYRGIDVMVVTPLRDGMNLVAKEFCASRIDDDGVLILSEFAGAAAELGEASIVNPYDINEAAHAFARALALSHEDRRRRMSALRNRVKLLDNKRWGESFLDALAAVRRLQKRRFRANEQHSRLILPETLLKLSEGRKIALAIDYDGTLVPIVQRPEMAEPSQALIERLTALSARDELYLTIVSGRSRENLDHWFGDLPLHLFAEHGFWERPPGGQWRPMMLATDGGWKERIREMLRLICLEIPGSFVEEKAQSLVWHYRTADPRLAEPKAREVHAHLIDNLSNSELAVMTGKKIIEVRHAGVHKGEAILTMRRLLDDQDYHFVAIGDDQTDEDMFRCLPADGLAVRVGVAKGLARYYLTNVSQVQRYLALLTERFLPTLVKKAT